jgi:hypothetical protein
MKLSKVLHTIEITKILKPSSLPKAAGLRLNQIEEAARTEQELGLRTSLLMVSSQKPEAILQLMAANLNLLKLQLKNLSTHSPAKTETNLEPNLKSSTPLPSQTLDSIKPKFTKKHRERLFTTPCLNLEQLEKTLFHFSEIELLLSEALRAL